MIKARSFKYLLNFKRPAGTSRGVLKTKETYFLILEDENSKGIGECALFKGLGSDDKPDYEDKLAWLCNNINLPFDVLFSLLKDYPSIVFGLETALLSLKSKDLTTLIPSDFTAGKSSIPINGLIWMGEQDFMLSQIQEKIDQGFSCIKMKIGAIDFRKELDTLKFIRDHFKGDQLELRVDANGAFTKQDVYSKLEKLAKYDLHSIEQPVAVRQYDLMADLCKEDIIDIALDEELIGVNVLEEKQRLLDAINPQYIILKPSLHGSFIGSDEWISTAEERGIKWWITSALESNIGLNAIAQYTFSKNSDMYQGLGTGGLYTNNIDSNLVIENGELKVDVSKDWDLEEFKGKI